MSACPMSAPTYQPLSIFCAIAPADIAIAAAPSIAAIHFLFVIKVPFPSWLVVAHLCAKKATGTDPQRTVQRWHLRGYRAANLPRRCRRATAAGAGCDKRPLLAFQDFASAFSA